MTQRIQHDSKPEPSSEYTQEQFDDEVIIYSFHDAKAVYLNQTAYLVYSLCDGNRTVSDIIELLQNGYPEAAGNLPQDVVTTLEDLMANKIITSKD